MQHLVSNHYDLGRQNGKMAVAMNSASSDMLLLMNLSHGMLKVVIVELVVEQLSEGVLWMRDAFVL